MAWLFSSIFSILAFVPIFGRELYYLAKVHWVLLDHTFPSGWTTLCTAKVGRFWLRTGLHGLAFRVPERKKKRIRATPEYRAGIRKAHLCHPVCSQNLSTHRGTAQCCPFSRKCLIIHFFEDGQHCALARYGRFWLQTGWHGWTFQMPERKKTKIRAPR